MNTLRYVTDELDLPIPHSDPELLAQSRAEAFADEIATMRLWASEHVMTFYSTWLNAQGILDRCNDRQHMRVAGLCVVHQASPSAKGFHVATLEDQWGVNYPG